MIPCQQYAAKAERRDAVAATAVPSAFPALSSCPRHEKIDPVGGEMLEVVLMPADVRLHVMRLQNRQQAVSKFNRIAVIGAGGIDRVVAENKLPRGFRLSECALEPAELPLGILTPHTFDAFGTIRLVT